VIQAKNIRCNITTVRESESEPNRFEGASEMLTRLGVPKFRALFRPVDVNFQFSKHFPEDLSCFGNRLRAASSTGIFDSVVLRGPSKTSNDAQQGDLYVFQKEIDYPLVPRYLEISQGKTLILERGLKTQAVVHYKFYLEF
jgi:hypothetical protein